jgi:hypothetical protein
VQVLHWAHDKHTKFKRMYTEEVIILKKVSNSPIWNLLGDFSYANFVSKCIRHREKSPNVGKIGGEKIGDEKSGFSFNVIIMT